MSRTAAFSLGKPDKKVIDAFLDKKPADSRKMETDGKTLDIVGMGGKGVAKWVGSKIDLVDLGSRSGQTVHRYIRKQAPANWLKGASMNPEAVLRKSLIRTAAALPKGSQERKAVLGLLGAPRQKAAGSGAANAKYLGSVSSRMKNEILRGVAKHYATSVREMESELTDRDAEALYEYITDHDLRSRVYREFKEMRLASQKSARIRPLPKARRDTNAGKVFREKAGAWAYDTAEAVLSAAGVPPQKISEFQDNGRFDLDPRYSKLRTQEEIIDWLTNPRTPKGFQYNLKRWSDAFGGGSSGLKQDAMKLVKGLDQKKLAVAIVVADLTWQWNLDSLYSVYSDIEKGSVSKDNLQKLVVALQWVSKQKLPKV